MSEQHKKSKQYKVDDDGSKVLYSTWTAADTVELSDGTTLEDFGYDNLSNMWTGTHDEYLAAVQSGEIKDGMYVTIIDDSSTVDNLAVVANTGSYKDLIDTPNVGDTDISDIGDGTITGAIRNVKDNSGSKTVYATNVSYDSSSVGSGSNVQTAIEDLFKYKINGEVYDSVTSGDFNNFEEDGIYLLGGTGSDNKPEGSMGRGILSIIKDGTIQFFIDLYEAKDGVTYIYMRVKKNDEWQDWQEYIPSYTTSVVNYDTYEIDRLKAVRYSQTDDPYTSEVGDLFIVYE